MKLKSFAKMRISILVVTCLLVVSGLAWAQTLPSGSISGLIGTFTDTLPSKTLAIAPTLAPVVCTIQSKLNEQDERFDEFNLYVAPRETTWTENRLGKDQTMKGPDRDIVLKILNLVDCELSFVVVRQHGATIVSPAGWDIRMLERANGIVFNVWNTAYQVVSPADHLVLKNKFPITKSKIVREQVRDSRGRVTKNAYVNEYSLDKYVIYSPYSPDLYDPILIQMGRDHIASVAHSALEGLRTHGVISRIEPGTLVADIPQLPQEFFERLPLLEQTDLFEFNLDPQETIDRVYIIVGANGRNAYNPTCSTAGACGLVQYTRKTWNNIRKAYPSAGLQEFETGVQDHIQSMTAAILLYDNNLADLKKRYGKRILDDPRLEEYLTAAYNGAPVWVTNSITAALRAKISDWIESLSVARGGLRKETRGYMVKLREMHRLGVPLKAGSE